MKRMIISCLFIVSTGALVAQTKPNIIVFIVDDMGWQDCSVPFYSETTELNKRFHTHIVLLTGHYEKIKLLITRMICYNHPHGILMACRR